jgi:RNA polymerase sigma-32 factor
MPKSKALKATSKAKTKTSKSASSPSKSRLMGSKIKKSSKPEPKLANIEFEIIEPEDLKPKSLTTRSKPNPSTIQKVQSDELLAPDALTQYLMKIRNYPVLTKEKEHELAVQYYESGDREAAELLVKSNLKFVVKIAMEYSKFGAKLIDIIQEGNVGLMHALKEYNPYKGVKLISYAVWWIRGYIQDYMMKQQSMVKIGTNQKQRKLFYQLEKEHSKILQEGLESTPLLLSQRLDVPEKDVLDMQQRLSHKDLSLDQTVSEDSDTSWLEQRTDDTSEPMDELIIQSEQLELLKDKIENLKKELNDKEIQLLELRILSDTPVTLKSLGDEWNVTREAARQTEARLIEKIKKAFLKE